MGRSDDFIQIKGVIAEALPNAIFRVRLETGHIILAHVSGRMRKNFIRLLPGDRVLLEISKYDPKKGRIIYRYSR